MSESAVRVACLSNTISQHDNYDGKVSTAITEKLNWEKYPI